jgi:hypothetical protein
MFPIDGFIVWVDLDGLTSTCFLSWTIENVMEVWSKFAKTTIWDLKYGTLKWNLNGIFSPYLIIDEYYKNYARDLGGLQCNMEGIWMIIWI